MLLLNAFSLNMLDASRPWTVQVQPLNLEQARAHLVSLESAVGHETTAAVLSTMLGVPVPCNRSTVRLTPGMTVVVAQYSGPRLPEGATVLPEGARIEFALVTVQ